MDKDIQLPTVLLHSQGTTKLQYLSQTYSFTHSLAPPSPFLFFFFCSLFFLFFFVLCFSSSYYRSLSATRISLQKYLAASPRIMARSVLSLKVYVLLTSCFFVPHQKSSPSLASHLHLVLYHAKCINQVVIGKLCQVPRGSVITKTGNLVSSFQPRATSRTTREVSSLL